MGWPNPNPRSEINPIFDPSLTWASIRPSQDLSSRVGWVYAQPLIYAYEKLSYGSILWIPQYVWIPHEFHMLIEKSHEMPRCHLDLDIHLPHNPTNQSSKRSPHIFSFSRKLAISLSSIPDEYIKAFFFFFPFLFLRISSLVLLVFPEIFQYRFWVLLLSNYMPDSLVITSYVIRASFT